MAKFWEIVIILIIFLTCVFVELDVFEASFRHPRCTGDVPKTYCVNQCFTRLHYTLKHVLYAPIFQFQTNQETFRIVQNKVRARRIYVISFFNPLIHPGKCGGVHNKYSGLITSPSYPHNYTDNLECLHEVTVAKGKTIKLKFSE